MNIYDTIVIGGGPGGLAAAIKAYECGAKTLLIEREPRLGGILKQCIHDGFGLVRFGEKLSGPEYAERFIDKFKEYNIDCYTLTFVTAIKKTDAGYELTLVNNKGVFDVTGKTLILATGCRERTAKQINIHGTRPSGVFSAGTAQQLTNIYGQKPAKKCVILGSGDIGLIMARRLTLEGSEVIGVYEAKSTPSGLTRNIHQCLHDFNIPLYLSHTVTRVFGDERLTAIEISAVDEKMQPIVGSEQIVECDALILSVGLIPENELAEKLNVKLDSRTKGPLCDASLMTTVDGIFSCGNALHVNDLVDYVSESGEIAGKASAEYKARHRKCINLNVGKNILYAVPQMIDLTADNSGVTLYFRSNRVLNNASLVLTADGKELYRKKFTFLRPPEMERLELNFNEFNLSDNSQLELYVEEAR